MTDLDHLRGTPVPYRARCALCEWTSDIAAGDDAAFDLLAAHGAEVHPGFGFPGGELVPEPPTDWESRIADGQRRLQNLRADLAAGIPEAEAAHRNGFSTRRDLALRVRKAVGQ